MRTSISVLLGLLIGLGWVLLRPAGGGTPEPDTLTTKRLRIVDEQGRECLLIEKSSIQFKSPQGQMRMLLTVGGERTSAIAIMDPEGKIRAQMDFTRASSAFTVFGDGKSSAQLMANSDVTGLSATDENGTQTLSAIGTPGPRFSLHDKKGKSLLDIRRTEAGKPAMTISDDGKIVGEFRPQDHMNR